MLMRRPPKNHKPNVKRCQKTHHDEEMPEIPNEEPDERKIEEEEEEKEEEEEEASWKDAIETIRQDLSKSGVKTWPNPKHPVFQSFAPSSHRCHQGG